MHALTRHFRLLNDIRLDEGIGFLSDLLDFAEFGDSDKDRNRSSLVIFENDVRLGPPHALHRDIRNIGQGRYSHWGRSLFFSSSDNSDPRSNGREYVVLVERQSPSATRRASEVLAALPTEFSRSDAYRAIESCLAIVDPLAKIGEDDKSFWRDHDFIRDYELFEGKNYRALERKFVVYNLVAALGHVPGDLAECGVFNGGTSYFMALAGLKPEQPRNLHLFDSFEGLSRPDHRDGTHWQAGDLACSLETVASNLRMFDNVNFYKGWIPKEFDRVSNKSFAFVHIDVDLHAPTADSIAFFYPRLAPGGMLLCDDYGFSTCPGATEAMNKYFEDKAERVIHLPTGQGLIIKQPTT